MRFPRVHPIVCWDGNLSPAGWSSTFNGWEWPWSRMSVSKTNWTSVDPKQFVWSRSKSRQVKNHAATAPPKDWRQWGTSVKSCGQSTHKRVEAVGDKCKIMQPQQPPCGRNASPETNVKSCGPVMHPFQRSKNPSQVNLFGEQELEQCPFIKR